MKPSEVVKKHGFGKDEIYNEMLEELDKRFIDKKTVEDIVILTLVGFKSTSL